MTQAALFDDDHAPATPEPHAHASTRPLVAVWRRGQFSTACRSCGQPMTMARVVSSGKWLPFDADPVAIRTSRDPQTHAAIDHLDLADVHFRSCPHAATHRRA